MNTNIQVGDRVRDNGSGYIKGQPQMGSPVDFGTVTEVGEGGVMVHWDGCHGPFFCSFRHVRPAYTDSDCGNEKVQVKRVEHDDYPVNWTSFEMEYLRGLDLGKMDNVNNPAHYGNGSITSDGGPSDYYDFRDEWKTWNDLADHKASEQWKEHSFHLGNIGKALYRWGNKSGTTKNYDARKIVYSGLRVLMMLEGKKNVRTYLESLLRDPQFKD
jgi:hypothetical protein